MKTPGSRPGIFSIAATRLGWRGTLRVDCVLDVRRYAVALRAVEDRVADVLRLERVAERRRAGFALRERLEEVGDVVDEAVLVADLQARHPVLVHVRVLAAGVGD